MSTRCTMFLLLLAGLLSFGCEGRQGAVQVDTGDAPLASAYRVDLYARSGGLDLVDGVSFAGPGRVTIDSVPEGMWTVLIQAQNGDQTTISYFQGIVEVEDGKTTLLEAGTYRPGLPGDPVPTSTSALSSFGPNGDALATALYRPPITGAAPSSVAIELINGTGQVTPRQVLRREAEAGTPSFRCATCLLREHDSSETPAPSINAQTTPRPSYASIAPGDTIDFFIATTFQNTTCERILTDAQTEHCMIFAEVVAGQPVISAATAQSVADAFDRDNPFQSGDNGIYNESRANIGSEWKTNPVGGRDEDERIILVFLSSNGIGGSGFFGFFRPQDQSSADQVSNSNLGEILYINADRVNADLYDGLATIAHEFSHLILHNEKRGQDGTFPDGALTENVVLDEGLAVLNEQLNGFDFSGANGGNFFLITSVDNLLESGLNRPFFQFRGALADYGAGYLLWRYMYDRFGPAIVLTMTSAPDVGLANISDKTGIDFDVIFLDFAQAVALNQTANLPAELSFQNLDLVEVYTDRSGTMFTLNGLEQIGDVTLPGTFTASETVEPWGVIFRRAVGGDGSALSWKAEGPDSVKTAVYPVAGAQR